MKYFNVVSRASSATSLSFRSTSSTTSGRRLPLSGPRADSARVSRQPSASWPPGISWRGSGLEPGPWLPGVALPMEFSFWLSSSSPSWVVLRSRCTDKQKVDLFRLVYNRLIYNRLIYNRLIYSKLIYNRLIYNKLIYHRLIYNRLIYNRFIYNRLIYNNYVQSLFKSRTTQKLDVCRQEKHTITYVPVETTGHQHLLFNGL